MVASFVHLRQFVRLFFAQRQTIHGFLHPALGVDPFHFFLTPRRVHRAQSSLALRLDRSLALGVLRAQRRTSRFMFEIHRLHSRFVRRYQFLTFHFNLFASLVELVQETLELFVGIFRRARRFAFASIGRLLQQSHLFLEFTQFFFVFGHECLAIVAFGLKRFFQPRALTDARRVRVARARQLIRRFADQRP